MAEHTPGPWSYYGRHTATVTQSTRWTVYFDDEHPPDGVSSGCEVFPANAPWEECEANARLIAASPEMLEALTKLVERADEVSDFMVRGADRRQDAMMDAIYDAQCVIRRAVGKDQEGGE